MSELKDFVIKYGVLKKYKGNGGNVVIPDSVTSIGERAFYHCTGITSIEIPNSVKSIGNYAFNGCAGLTSTNVSGGNAKYHSSGNCLIETASKTLIAGCSTSLIPDDGSVNHIGKYAFEDCTGLTNITIPSSVTSVGKSAFSGCAGLISVTIGNGVTSIGDRAFCNCKGLKSITIPDSVTSIGERAFYHCTGITSVTIPDSVTSIGDSAFSDCAGLTSITIPDSVTSIGFRAFYGCRRLKSITIPDSVKIIRYGAFEDCAGLKSITIPGSVTNISSSAFYNTPWFNDQPDGLVYAGKVAYKYKGTCPASVTIKEGTLGICEDAFYRCAGLTSINIPDSVTSIGKCAFLGCTGLKSITIPGSVTSIGDSAFYHCDGIKTIILPKEDEFKGSALEVIWNAFFDTNKSALLVSFLTQLPELVQKDKDIGRKIKVNKKKIVANAIETDNADALDVLFSLYKKIELEELNEYIDKAAKTVNVKAFLLNYKSRNYSPDDQEKIENRKAEIAMGAQKTLSELKKEWQFEKNDTGITLISYKGKDVDVLVPETVGGKAVTEIGKYAFSPLKKGLRKEEKEFRKTVRSVTIPYGITSIGEEAFFDCTGLTSITISDSVKRIGDSAFSGCTGLKSITIPDSVKRIGYGAFYGCAGLTSTNVSGGNAKYHSSGNCLIETASKTLISGCNTSVIPTDGSVNYIGYGAFSYCTGLTSITIPGSVTGIGERAFSGCTGLTIITIPGSVTSIGERAFDGCTGLTSITISGSVTSIGDYAFCDCTGLKSITIPGSVKSIGYGAFSYCTGFTSITIPDSVKRIGYGAFYGCKHLTIHAPTGSYAERYAKKNKIPFVAE